MDRIRTIIGKMTLEEKASMCSGGGCWTTEEIKRLGIPEIWLTDGPHGLRKHIGRKDSTGADISELAVSFPSAVATASSFNTEVARRIGAEIGEECLRENVQVLLGPGANIKRHPLCGRNFEYFSEDPLLAGETAAAFINGLQEKGVAACVKHFCANNQETWRMTISSEVGERALREIYAAVFERIVKKSKPCSIMASYNRINGVYATENRKTIREMLRKEWGYEGCVISDWCAVHSREEAIKGGTCLTMPGASGTDHEIVDAVRAGTLSEELVDEAVEYILNLVFWADSHRLPEQKPIDFSHGHEVAYMSEVESAVLLKNDGLLPLDSSKRIAFIGDMAEFPRYQGGGSSMVNTENSVSALAAVKGYCDVTFARGYNGPEVDNDLIAEAVKAAKTADVAVVFAGLSSITENEGFDRPDMELPENNNALIRAVAAVNSNTVVVLHTGSPVTVPWEDDVRSILQVFYGGEAVGEATCDLLFGRRNPSGHLAETWPLRLEDTPAYLTFPGDSGTARYIEDVYVGYRYYETRKMPVRYPFGHGLSYTVFEYSDLKLDKEKFGPDDEVGVSVKVKNTGNMGGSAVTQLYVYVNKCPIMRPSVELRAFEKTELQPGEEKELKFTLTKRDFSYWDTKHGCFRMPRGKYEIRIGSSVRDIALSATIEAEDEIIPENMRYDIMSVMEDVLKHPLGKEFFSTRSDEITDGLLRSGIAGHNKGRTPTKEELLEMAEALYSQPLLVVGMYLPYTTDEEIAELIDRMNGK